jgi:hypothetical protein
MLFQLAFRGSVLQLLLTGALLSAARGALPSTPEFVMNVDSFDHRLLQEQFFNGTAKCYSTVDAQKQNR